jgi:hypothetical protein
MLPNHKYKGYRPFHPFFHAVFRLIASVLLASVLLQGCYTFSATSLPPHIRTIQIFDVDNRSSAQPLVAERLKQGFREMFRSNASSVQLVNENAHADLKVSIRNYRNVVESSSRNAQVQNYRVTITVDVVFKDNVKDRMIYEGKNITGYGIYDVSINESEELHGQKRAIEMLKETVINNSMSDW